VIDEELILGMGEMSLLLLAMPALLIFNLLFLA